MDQETNYISNSSIIGLVTPDMLATITWGTYIFFAAFCLIALAFTFFCIPETRGKVRISSIIYLPPISTLTDSLQTLEDMDLVFGDTAAHEERQRIVQIEAELRGTPIMDSEHLKDKMVEEAEHVA